MEDLQLLKTDVIGITVKLEILVVLVGFHLMLGAF